VIINKQVNGYIFVKLCRQNTAIRSFYRLSEVSVKPDLTLTEDK
jgi:hypothetical protein